MGDEKRSDPQLRRWYREYNHRYFGGSLPKSTLLYYVTVDRCYGNCQWMGDRFHIRINPDAAVCRRGRRFTLLHEMAHIATWPRVTHGKYFDQEMLRLASVGALKGLW